MDVNCSRILLSHYSLCTFCYSRHRCGTIVTSKSIIFGSRPNVSNVQESHYKLRLVSSSSKSIKPSKFMLWILQELFACIRDCLKRYCRFCLELLWIRSILKIRKIIVCTRTHSLSAGAVSQFFIILIFSRHLSAWSTTVLIFDLRAKIFDFITYEMLTFSDEMYFF